MNIYAIIMGVFVWWIFYAIFGDNAWKYLLVLFFISLIHTFVKVMNGE